MSVTVACDECFPAAKNVVRFSEEIYERDKIERLVYDWCAGQKITPVACPNDLLRCLKTRCLAIAANAGVGTPCNEIILPCFRDVIVQDGEIDIGLDCAWNRAVQYEETGIRFFAQNLPPPIGFDRRGTDDDYSACSCSDGRQGFADTHIVGQDDTPVLPAKSLGFKLMRLWDLGREGFFVLRLGRGCVIECHRPKAAGAHQLEILGGYPIRLCGDIPSMRPCRTSMFKKSCSDG